MSQQQPGTNARKTVVAGGWRWVSMTDLAWETHFVMSIVRPWPQSHAVALTRGGCCLARWRGEVRRRSEAIVMDVWAVACRRCLPVRRETNEMRLRGAVGLSSHPLPQPGLAASWQALEAPAKAVIPLVPLIGAPRWNSHKTGNPHRNTAAVHRRNIQSCQAVGTMPACRGGPVAKAVRSAD